MTDFTLEEILQALRTLTTKVDALTRKVEALQNDVTDLRQLVIRAGLTHVTRSGRE